MSAQVSQRPPIEPGPPRWRRVLRRVLTTGIKIVCFVEAVHFLSDRSAKHQLRRHGWEDTSNFTEDEENTEEEAKDQVMDLLIDYVNGDVEVTAFSEIPRDTLLRSLESIDDAALESLGVKRGDGEAKAQAEGLLRGLKEALNKNNDKDDTPGSKTPSHKSKVDRPGSIRQARPAPAKLKGPLDS